MLAFALALHVADEALTGFLAVYNPTAVALRARFSRLPIPTFHFGEWLAGLLTLVGLLFLVTPMFYRGGRPIRQLAWAFAVLMIGNGLGHIAGTIFGRTVGSVHFSRPMPGFYSSPLLILASIWVIVELHHSRG